MPDSGHVDNHGAALNTTETREWLEIVYGDTPGLINICSTSDWSGRFFTPSSVGGIDAAMSYITQLDEARVQGIYLRATTLRHRPDDGHRGGDDLSYFLPGLWADLDIAGPGHKTTRPLPPTIDDAMKIVAHAGLPDPSHWIHSGGGLYAWWLLKQPLAVTPDDLEYVRGLSAGWQKVLADSAEQLGFFYGSGVGDLSRVLRIPGTINRKTDTERPCTGLGGRAWSGGLYTFEDLADALQEASARFAPSPHVSTPAASRLEAKFASQGQRPGDHFNEVADWRDILAPRGWEWVYKRGDTWHLRRPGKNEGTSATLRDSTGRLFVFSDATEFEPNRSYSKFEAATLLEYGGNFQAAARDLGKAGFGDRVERQIGGDFWDALGPTALTASDPASPSRDVAPVMMAEVVEVDDVPVPPIPKFEEWSEIGQGRYFAEMFGDQFREVKEERGWRVYRNGVWVEDIGKAVRRAAQKVTGDFRDQIYALHRQAVESGDKSAIKETSKLVTRADHGRTDRGIGACVNQFSDQPGIAVSMDEFDQADHLLALSNGTFDLNTMALRAHDPRDMITKKINVDYDPSARAPKFQAALEQWVPDAGMRDYLQRAVGYTLSGRVDHGAFFILHGKTGCGKSAFINVISAALGQYAQTAAASTFRAAKYGEKNSYDLHQLRGARLVTTSETSENTMIDEELIKRVTGGDPVTTCAKFQSNITWRPKFVPWMLTNFLPHMNSEDSATWRRVKPIEFPNSFVDGEVRRDYRIAENLIADELAGIFNWVLDGVRAYHDRGLDDPVELKQAVQEYRTDVDPISQFVADASDEGTIVLGETLEVKSSELYRVYATWSVNNNRRPVGDRKFGRRMSDLGFGVRKGTGGTRVRTGIGLNPHDWIGGRTTPAIQPPLRN